MMRGILNFLVPALLVLLILLVVLGLGFGIVTLVIAGVGRLLRWFYPFTIFESMLLGAVLTACTLYVLFGIVRLFIPAESLRFPTAGGDEDGGEAKEYKRIPASRFYKSTSARTWEAWLRQEIANDIYMEFQDEPRTVSNMNDSQVQELALRLSELGLTILKRKTGRTRDLTMNVSTLKRELQRMGQRAYDDKILQLAVNAININMDYYEEDIYEVIRAQSWQELADMPEDEG